IADHEFDDMVLHVDGYLCALKDAQIRGGLHVLGRGPEGEALVDFVLAVTRLPQGQVPSLRAVVAADLGFDPRSERRHEVDKIEAECRHRVEALAPRDWAGPSDPQDPAAAVEHWICARLIPALATTPDEVTATLAALAGGYVAAGPTGAPSRGAAHVLPPGRNFYSVDPKALPSALSWEVGRQLADELVARHIDETGRPPTTGGLGLGGG